MKIPNAEQAVIEVAKIREYLLSPTHSVGRFKAAFFSGLGYSIRDWRRLENDLKAFAISEEAVGGRPSDYGKKYEVRGIIKGPNGKDAAIVTVWIVPFEDRIPRFVTAYPGEKP